MWNIVTRAFEFGFIRTSGELPNEENTWSVKITCWRFRVHSFAGMRRVKEYFSFVNQINSHSRVIESHTRDIVLGAVERYFCFRVVRCPQPQKSSAFKSLTPASERRSTKVPSSWNYLKNQKYWSSLSRILAVAPSYDYRQLFTFIWSQKNIPYFCRQIKVCWSKQQSSKSRYSSFEK